MRKLYWPQLFLVRISLFGAPKGSQSSTIVEWYKPQLAYHGLIFSPKHLRLFLSLVYVGFTLNISVQDNDSLINSQNPNI